eukprot:NODE_2157_length_984_cov_528.786868.p1 GENE.NODE_2157_length_984_cov_528.786868~~NODE_2157_length_984_cov_528.786868.p1  ORF type:complete len:276 (-),score=96.25 NODE_2157_length_984_cov_528.786868:155-904(-)
MVFPLLYNLILIVVGFGLFNLIAAVYIENTLASAKHQSDNWRAQKKEAVRVARNTRKLVSKFYAAQRVADATGALSEEATQAVMDNCTELDLREEDIKIEKDTFCFVMQDPSVQVLLDDLDITSSERVRLFNVLDSDCSGNLDVRELVHGLMMVRGEAQRSDIVACLLAVRSLQQQVRNLESHVAVTMDTCGAASPAKTAIRVSGGAALSVAPTVTQNGGDGDGDGECVRRTRSRTRSSRKFVSLLTGH